MGTDGRKDQLKRVHEVGRGLARVTHCLIRSNPNQPCQHLFVTLHHEEEDA